MRNLAMSIIILLLPIFLLALSWKIGYNQGRVFEQMQLRDMITDNVDTKTKLRITINNLEWLMAEYGESLNKYTAPAVGRGE